MVGTFGGALEARQIDASNGKLVGEVTGEVETEEGVLVIRRIHVVMKLAAPESSRATPCAARSIARCTRRFSSALRWNW